MKLKCDELLSNVAFSFNLRRYTMEALADEALEAMLETLSPIMSPVKGAAAPPGWKGEPGRGPDWAGRRSIRDGVGGGVTIKGTRDVDTRFTDNDKAGLASSGGEAAAARRGQETGTAAPTQLAAVNSLASDGGARLAAVSSLARSDSARESESAAPAGPYPAARHGPSGRHAARSIAAVPMTPLPPAAQQVAWRCNFTVPKPVFKAPVVSALELTHD